ncbi:uncharacterized protein LOC117109565 [Anneissia japonica]|uniref:uncharacterized protein LOC117109565 n=1 Tax=Anneissia japonica TaxID=1529436 RepID=UPI0014255A20|nr:uncharacterized protein LOC117109565 [Anneissia japonica]
MASTTAQPTTEDPTTLSITTEPEEIIYTKIYCPLNAMNMSDMNASNSSSNSTSPVRISCTLEPFSQVALPLQDGLGVTDDGIVDDAVKMEGVVGDSGSYLSLPFNGECALEPYMCESGLTVGLFLKLSDEDLEQNGPKYIISSGYGNATGFDIYRNSTSVVMQVRDGNYLWTATVNSALDNSGWIHVAFVWSEEEGITVNGDDCRGVLCRNGRCKDNGIQSFVCLCDTGYIGTYCEENEDDCAVNPCINDGTCRDGVGEYICACVFGFSGDTCEIDLTPTFNYSNTAVVMPEDLLNLNDDVLQNPAYEVAHRFETMSSTSGNDITVFVDAIGRGGEGTYTRMTAETSWMNALTGGDGECLSRPDLCTNGFAVSFWIMVETSVDLASPAIIFNAGANKGMGAFTILELTENAGLILTVGYSAGTTIGSTDNHAVELGHWVNIGLTWSEDAGLALYINAHKIRLSVRRAGRPGNSNSGRMTFGTLFQPNLYTAYPVAISDFVVWDRYLYPFERHRFLGVTATECSYLRDAVYYWTTDAYIIRDLSSLSLYPSNLVNTSQLVLPGGQNVQLSAGRDLKGEASHVNGTENLWFLLGDLPGTCISDPFLCPDGVTLAIWAKIYPVHDNQAHFIVSTGEQATRGMSLYMRAGVLGASLIDGDRKWITEIAFTPNPDDWLHLAISWKKDSGMVLYKNGAIVSYDAKGLRKIREADLDTKIILGRRNDFLDAYSAMEFEELIFWEKYVETWEAREVFGLPGRAQYDDAVYRWTAKQLITSTLDILIENSLGQDEYIGPTPSVRMLQDPTAVDLTQENAALNLGSFSSGCFVAPLNCVEGLSISFWLKLLHGSVDDPVGYLLSAGRGDDSGIAIYKEGHDLVFLVEDGSDLWTTKTSIQVVPDDEWSNVAFTWSANNGLTVYIDGNPQAPANVTSVHKPLESAANDHLTVGRPNDAKSADYGNFVIHNLVIWDKYMYPRKASSVLTTLTDSQVDCIHNDKICWPFESLLSLRYPYSLSSTGASYVFDRDYGGRAVYTNGRTGWISLGNFRNACPKKLSSCENGFTLSMWLRLEDNPRNTGVLVSLGAEMQNEQGIALVKDELGLEATVADGSLLWRSRIYNGNFTYGSWMFFAMTWSAEAGVSLFIDGADLTHGIDNRTESIRSGLSYNELFLGRGGMNDNKIKAYFDDVELEFPKATEKLPDEDELTGIEAVVAYASADEYFDLATNEDVILTDSVIISDRNNDANSAVNTGVTNTSVDLGYIDVGRFRRSCVSDPSKCTPSGVTISVWVKMNSIEHFQDNNTNPSGLGYFLSSGAQAQYGRGFALTFDGQNITATMQHADYMITFNTLFEPPTDWFNLALSWSVNQGLRIYINGVISGSSTERITTPVKQDYVTNLHLGKRNDEDADYLGASFDDFAIWFTTFEPDDPALADALQGEEEEIGVVVTVNHPELDALAPFSGKPDCKILHDADCARSIHELNDVLSDESIINGTVLISARKRLRYLVNPNNDVPENDLEYAVEVFKAITTAPVTERLNKTEAESDLLDLVQITSNMMQPNRSNNWKSVHEVSLGTPQLVDSLDEYAIQISRRLRERAGHEKIVISAENIVMQIDSFDMTEMYEQYTLPDYNQSNWDSAKTEWNQPQDQFILPKNFFKFTKPGITSSLVVTLYNTLPDMIPEEGNKDVEGLEGGTVKVNSRIASLTADPPLRMDLYNPMKIILSHIQRFEKSSTEETACAFWNHSAPNTTNGAWDTRGCELFETNETMTICHCYHMTSFAIIIKPIIEEEKDSNEGSLNWMTRILSIFSIAFLGVFLFYLAVVRRLRVTLHKIHINLCVAVIFACFSLALSGFIKEAWGDCMISGALIHYFNTVIICVMFIEAFHLYSDLSDSLEIHDDDDDEDEPPFRDRVKYYVLFVWGAPFLNVGTTIGFSSAAYIEQEAGFCWLDETDFLWCSFAGPLVAFGLSTLYMLYSMLRDIDDQVYKEDRTTIFRSSYVGTWILQIYFLIAWGIGLVGIYGLGVWAIYLFVFTISLFGVVVFIVHAVLNTEVRLLLCWRDPDKELTAIEEINLVSRINSLGLCITFPIMRKKYSFSKVFIILSYRYHFLLYLWEVYISFVV